MESLPLAGIPLSFFPAALYCLESGSIMSQSFSGAQTLLPEAHDHNCLIQNKIACRAIVHRSIHSKVIWGGDEESKKGSRGSASRAWCRGPSHSWKKTRQGPAHSGNEWMNEWITQRVAWNIQFHSILVNSHKSPIVEGEILFDCCCCGINLRIQK